MPRTPSTFNTTRHIVVSETPGLYSGFLNATISFPDACPYTGIMPKDPPNGTATVVKVTAMGDALLGGYSLWMSNCDMTNVVNATKTGVYVIQGGLAYLIPERKAGGVCGGPDQIAYQTASLADYCRVDTTLSDCSKVIPISPTSSATRAVKCHSVVALLGFVALFAAAASTRGVWNQYPTKNFCDHFAITGNSIYYDTFDLFNSHVRVVLSLPPHESLKRRLSEGEFEVHQHSDEMVQDIAETHRVLEERGLLAAVRQCQENKGLTREQVQACGRFLEVMAPGTKMEPTRKLRSN